VQIQDLVSYIIYNLVQRDLKKENPWRIIKQHTDQMRWHRTLWANEGCSGDVNCRSNNQIFLVFYGPPTVHFRSLL